MIAENYWQVNEILRRLLEAEPASRHEILKNAEISNEIRAEVESLLESEQNIDDFMTLSIADFSRDILEIPHESDQTNFGQKIGSYRITGDLGNGGMGAVYLAERVDGKFNQKVALKMLRREYNNENIRQFFRRESEIQARLEHPNIARLLDAGTTTDGVPFIVMEYVEGVAVDKFCAENDLPVKAKLKLFNKICQAVAHAHQNLIVHRDLKPSNILVNRSGEPKLLDFGISKLLDDEITDKTSLTALGAMTPEYASPEQIKGESVSTATDIYSLGVILYKILTGHLPYDLKGKKNGEILKTVTEHDPVKPSAVSNSDKKFRDPQLKGDLDNIILKALAKEPERRYKTVEQFSADLWRHLDGLPVSARPANLSYRAGKFFRRNRVSVIAAALILLSLVGGIGVSLHQAKTARAAQINAEQQSLLARAEEEKAKKEEEKSRKITRFMFKVFGYANPAWYAEGNKSGGQARVLDALDDLSTKVETEFPEEIDIQAELHHQFAEVFGRIVSYDTEPARREEFKAKSRFHICRGLELRRQFYGDWHELVAKDMYFGAGCIGKNPQEEAAVWNKAIEIFRATNPNNLNLPYLLTDYAARLAKPHQAEVHQIYLQAVSPPTGENKYQIAERYYREALPLYRQHYQPDNLPIFQTECNLSYVLASQEKWTDFDEHFAVCRQGAAEIGKSSSDAESAKHNPILIINKILAEKGIIR